MAEPSPRAINHDTISATSQSQANKIRRPCYLQRAIHFNPKYSIPYALYGYYLHKVGKLEDANKQYKKAMELDPDNAKHAYSYSELLIDMKEYDEALKYAQLAYKKSKPPRIERQTYKAWCLERMMTPCSYHLYIIKFFRQKNKQGKSHRQIAKLDN